MEKEFTIEHTHAAKGLAIILLLTYHLFENENLITSLNVNYAPFSLSRFLLFTGFGNSCVSIFVFITAYGITTGLLKQESLTMKTTYRQAWNRLLILVLHFSFMYISINLLWFYKFDYQSLYGLNKQGFVYILTDMLGFAQLFGTPTLNATWWYMEVAFILIFLVPFLAWLVKRIGYPALMGAVLFPALMIMNEDLERYLFVIVFGVCAAYGRWPAKLLYLRISYLFKWIIGIGGFILCVHIRQNYIIYNEYVHLIDAPVSLFLIWISSDLLFRVPGLKQGLSFIGRHSMNIYLVHTFFYMALWQQYIYQFRYAGITLLLLLIICLLYSVLLELIKKLCRFSKLIEKLARYNSENA